MENEVPPSPASDISLEQAADVITTRRETINQLLQDAASQAAEGDEMYILPQAWYDMFLNVNNNSDVTPIDTNSICKDYDNFILNDFNAYPYTSVPASVFDKFVEWYSLAKGSKPVVTYLLKDPNSGELTPEYNRIVMRLHHLTQELPPKKSSFHYNYHKERNDALYFTVSRFHTLGDIFKRVSDLFFGKETHFDVKKNHIKIWGLRAVPVNDPLTTSYKMSPKQFLNCDSRLPITKDIFGKVVKDWDDQVFDFAIELKLQGKKNHWPSNYFMFNQLVPSSGTLGLVNLGNSCYMNSALQCLVHIPKFNQYFFYDGFEKEINTENPIGYKGAVARSFGKLIQKLFEEHAIDTNKKNNMSISSFSPSSFKSTIGHCNSMFYSYAQQDSQELLAFLLDALHEDLNRVIKKPYIEKPELPTNSNHNDFYTIKKLADDTWDAHLKRNYSIVTDLFVGMYKSTLKCPECNSVSVTFDPYSDLTLPLPVESIWSKTIKIFPQSSPPCSLEVELDKTSSYADLKKYIAKRTGLEKKNLYGFEIYTHQFYNNYESSDSGYLSVQELISETDDVIFYEIPDAESNIIVPVINTKIDAGFKSNRPFGVPFFLSFNESEINNPGLIRYKLEKRYSTLSGGFIEFPLLPNVGATELDDLPKLKEKYSEEDFTKYEELIKYSLPDEDIKINSYFDIKILKSSQNYSLKSISNTEKVWAPAPESFYNAKDIKTYLSPVVRDIYEYYSDTVEDNTENKEETSDLSTIKSEASASKEENVHIHPLTHIDSEPMKHIISEDQDMIDADLSDMRAFEDSINDTNASFSNAEINEDIDYNLPLLSKFDILICEWTDERAEEVFFNDNRAFDWEKPAPLKNPSLEASRAKRKSKKRKDISLNDCLRLFSKTEVLGVEDAWYCPTCKTHRQATKKIQLWNTPDILLIHLKRFESQRSFSDKIDATVNFPITDLDLTQHIVNKEQDKSNIYDLIAVDNHYGGLGGGHYTAYVKNFIDDKWYYFDDSRVSPADPHKSVSGSAYLLFYARRQENAEISHPVLDNILKESRTYHETQITSFIEKQRDLYEFNRTDSEESNIESEDESQSNISFSHKESASDSESDLESETKDLELLSNKSSHTELEKTVLDTEPLVKLDTATIEEEEEPTAADLKKSLSRSNDYYSESVEVGDVPMKLDNEINSSRRKLRLLNRNYGIGGESVSSNSSGTSDNDLIISNDASSISGSGVDHAQKEEAIAKSPSHENEL